MKYNINIFPKFGQSNYKIFVDINDIF